MVSTSDFQNSTRSPLAMFILASSIERYVRSEYQPNPTAITWRVDLSDQVLKNSQQVTSYALLRDTPHKRNPPPHLHLPLNKRIDRQKNISNSTCSMATNISSVDFNNLLDHYYLI